MKEPMIGIKFGRVTVIADAPSHFQPSGQRKRCVIGKCECGTKKTFRANDLRAGNTTSCGCRRMDGALSATLRHGGAINGMHTPIYKTWCHLRDRCFNKNNKSYPNYGGRGITVCERWLGRDGFIHFAKDMGPRPVGTTIDRKNNDGNYEPSNCRWATKVQQMNNMRTNVFVEYLGESKTLAQWEKELGLSQDLIGARMLRGMSAKEAIEKPVRQWPGKW